MAHGPWELAQASYPLGHWPSPTPVAVGQRKLVCRRKRDWSTPANAPVQREMDDSVREPAPAVPGANPSRTDRQFCLPRTVGEMDEPDRNVSDGALPIATVRSQPPNDAEASVEAIPPRPARPAAIIVHLMPRRSGAVHVCAPSCRACRIVAIPITGTRECVARVVGDKCLGWSATDHEAYSEVG